MTSPILSHDSNYIHVAMWPKFSNSSISIWEVAITSVLQYQEKLFLRDAIGSNLRPTLGAALKF